MAKDKKVEVKEEVVEVEETPVVEEQVVKHLDRDPNDPRNNRTGKKLPSLDD